MILSVEGKGFVTQISKNIQMEHTSLWNCSKSVFKHIWDIFDKVLIACSCWVSFHHMRHWFRTLQWCHNGLDGVSNHQPYPCLLSRLFGRRSKKTSKLRVTGLCEGNSPGTGEFPAQMASNAENVSIWWRHHYAVLQSFNVAQRGTST